MVHDFIVDKHPSHIVEVGADNGYSTTAIVESILDGWLGIADIVDIKLSYALKGLVDGINNICGDKIVLREMSGADGILKAHYERGQVDCVILDGDHHWEYVREEIDVSRRIGVKYFILHDINLKSMDGPKKALDLLRKQGFFCFTDSLDRPGMETHRGLAICEKR